MVNVMSDTVSDAATGGVIRCDYQGEGTVCLYKLTKAFHVAVKNPESLHRHSGLFRELPAPSHIPAPSVIHCAL